MAKSGFRSLISLTASATLSTDSPAPDFPVEYESSATRGSMPKARAVWAEENAMAANRVGRGDYRSFVENGLAAIRERDELWLRIRYTF